MSASITTIAEKLDLSVSTVSKALNEYKDVAPATRALVKQTALELGYQPSFAARSLRKGKTDKIGLFLNTSIEYVIEYLSGIIRGAVLEAESEGKNIVLYTNSADDTESLLRLCRTREIDGIILFSSHYTQATIDELLTEEFPFVVMGKRVLNERVSYVVPDYYDGSVQAIHHLVQQGHKKIAFMTRPQLGITNTERLQGYVDAMHAANLPIVDEYIVETRIVPQGGTEPTRQLLALSSPPTAICTFHDLLALDALQVIRQANLRVPQDIAVVGFDGFRSSLMTVPTLTTIQQPLKEIGQRVTEILLQLINDPHAKPIQETVEVELVTRGSSDFTR